MVFSKSWCGFCSQAKAALTQAKQKFEVLEIDESGHESSVQGYVKSKYKHRTVPAVFVNGKLLGGCDDTLAALKRCKGKDLPSCM